MKSDQAPKVIVFDFFGVVCVDLAQLTGAEFSRHYGIDPVAFSRFGSEHRQELDEGRMSQLDFAGELGRHFKLVASPAEISSELDALDGRFYAFDHELHDLIITLKQTAIVALMSNSSRDESDHLRAIGAYDVFDHVYLSASSGKTKDDITWFADISSELNLEPSELMLIDDLQHNVETALAAGWVNSVRYTGVAALRRDLSDRHITLS